MTKCLVLCKGFSPLRDSENGKTGSDLYVIKCLKKYNISAFVEKHLKEKTQNVIFVGQNKRNLRMFLGDMFAGSPKGKSDSGDYYKTLIETFDKEILLGFQPVSSTLQGVFGEFYNDADVD